VLFLKPMDWLTFRQPDETRSMRETSPSVTEILPQLQISECPGIYRAPTVAIAFIHVNRTMALDEAATYVKRRRICAPYTVMLEEFFAQRAAAHD
jgi:hypothetical protein